MYLALITGFLLGLSLIVAIGSQNAFVIRLGILKKHVFQIALFCSISDTLLIILGVKGISFFLNDLIDEFINIIFGFAALWLFFYGALRLRSAFKINSVIIESNLKPTSLLNSISIVAAFTFLNPHVYLDTVLLIGSVSQQFLDQDKVYFIIGACAASFVWFFAIAYGAKLISPIIQKPSQWKILDSLIALIMFVIAFKLAYEGGWL